MNARHGWARWLPPGVMGLGIVALGTALVARVLGYYLNVTPSLPLGLYRAQEAPALARGMIVLACLPRDMAVLARTRHYVPRGTCPGGVAPIGKRIVALAGDTVVTTRVGLRVNTQHIPDTAPWARDSHGRPLPQLTDTVRVLARGMMWLTSVSPRGFDSRYVGAIPTYAIRACVTPVWTIADTTPYLSSHRRSLACLVQP